MVKIELWPGTALPQLEISSPHSALAAPEDVVRQAESPPFEAALFTWPTGPRKRRQVTLLHDCGSQRFANSRRQAERISLADDGAAKIAALREHGRNANLENNVEKSCKTPEHAG